MREADPIRINHVLSCFFLGHEYQSIGLRDGYHEYVCLRCGHPLLFASSRNPYAGADRFVKKVRYLCNLFGHRVHAIRQKQGYTEYACDCGHVFLRKESGLRRITHPPICTVAGHWIHEVERRVGLHGYLCKNCGHSFYFTKSYVETLRQKHRTEWLGAQISRYFLRRSKRVLRATPKTLAASEILP